MRGRGLLCVCGAACAAACGVELEGPGTLEGTGAWGTPALVAGASSAVDEDDPTLGTSALELFFAYTDPDDGDNKHLYTMTRESRSGAWSAPRTLPFDEPGTVDQTPRLSADELTLYFASDRGPGRGLDIYRVSRPSVDGAWGQPELLDEVGDPGTDDKWFAPCLEGRYLLISKRGNRGDDVYEGVLGQGAPALVSELTTMSGETGPFLSSDCRTIHFASQRTGQNKLYTARRGAVTDRWSEPVELAEFAALGGNQEDPWLAPDNRTFVFVSDAAGSKDLYFATR
jgi:hypothetical protein